MITLATSQDAVTVAAQYTSLLTYEQEHGSTSNWVLNLYPTLSTATQAQAKKQLYVLKDGATVCSSIILNQEQAKDYAVIAWPTAATPEEVLVIHTLCVPPEFQGHGYATALVHFAEDLALQLHCNVIRLDTWDNTHPARQL